MKLQYNYNQLQYILSKCQCIHCDGNGIYVTRFKNYTCYACKGVGYKHTGLLISELVQTHEGAINMVKIYE